MGYIWFALLIIVRLLSGYGINLSLILIRISYSDEWVWDSGQLSLYMFIYFHAERPGIILVTIWRWIMDCDWCLYSNYLLINPRTYCQLIFSPILCSVLWFYLQTSYSLSQPNPGTCVFNPAPCLLYVWFCHTNSTTGTIL